MAAPIPKSSVISNAATLLLLLVAVGLSLQSQMAGAQSCTGELTNLNVCAPFVVPGAPDTIPSAECCSALQAVEHDCLCSTVRIAARLPTSCNLTPFNCAN